MTTPSSSPSPARWRGRSSSASPATRATGTGPGSCPPPLPWRALGSRSVEISIGRERQPNGADDKPDLKDIFGQGFDRSYSEFDAQLATYRSLLGQEEPRPADPPSPNGARRGARRKARRQGTSKRATGRGD